MTFLELARRRFSARHFKDRPVEKEKLLQVLEAGRIAPSAANRQPWHFVVVQDEQMRRDVATTYHKPWILEAPVIIVICGDHNLSWRRPDGKDHLDIDIGIAVDHMTLAAAELGLGTCWVCMFNSMLCHEMLKLPPNIETVALLPLGYPVDGPDVNRHQTKRKPLEEIVHWDKF